MDEKPNRRPWFQLHLSTCMVLMVVAGVLVYFNTKPLGSKYQPSYGWPAIAYESYFEELNISTLDELPDNLVLKAQFRWVWNGVIFDGALALLMLGLAARYLEEWIWRRQRKQEAKMSVP